MAPCDSGATHIAFGEHDGLGLHNVVISWLNPTPHAITVYASDPALPRRPQHSLPGGSLRLTRTGLAPVGSRQLRLAHRVRTPHWQAEARSFRGQARRRYRASMAQKLDIPGLYADALYALPETIDGVPPLPVPDGCPVTLDELLAE